MEKLSEGLAKVSPDDDEEEVKRRSQLAKFVSRSKSYLKLTPNRSLEDIEKRSLALSEKGKAARFLDKAQDSQKVIRLVEELRQAILIYQVSSRHCQIWKSLTSGTGVATAINI